MVQIVLIGFYSLTYRYYRVAHNLSMFQALLYLGPMLLGMLLAVVLIARLWAYQQIRQVIAIGFIFVAIAIAVMAAFARLPYWVQIFPLAMFGIGIIATKTIWTNAFFQITCPIWIYRHHKERQGACPVFFQLAVLLLWLFSRKA